jgi:pre-mRNA-processing factor 17
MTEHSFRIQHLTHSILGYSQNPSNDPHAPAILGSVTAAEANGFATIDALRPRVQEKKALKRKRGKKGDLEIVEGEGAYVGPWASWEGDGVQDIPDFMDEDGAEEEEAEAEEEAATFRKSKPRKNAYAQGAETSIFHGKSLTDYQGRTYMAPPLGVAPHIGGEAGSQECFIPKACVHTYTGHTQGVSVIRLLPGTGHLLLSGSMDTKIKVCTFHLLCFRELSMHLGSCGMCITKGIV